MPAWVGHSGCHGVNVSIKNVHRPPFSMLKRHLSVAGLRSARRTPVAAALPTLCASSASGEVGPSADGRLGCFCVCLLWMPLGFPGRGRMLFCFINVCSKDSYRERDRWNLLSAGSLAGGWTGQPWVRVRPNTWPACGAFPRPSVGSWCRGYCALARAFDRCVMEPWVFCVPISVMGCFHSAAAGAQGCAVGEGEAAWAPVSVEVASRFTNLELRKPLLLSAGVGLVPGLGPSADPGWGLY